MDYVNDLRLRSVHAIAAGPDDTDNEKADPHVPRSKLQSSHIRTGATVAASEFYLQSPRSGPKYYTGQAMFQEGAQVYWDFEDLDGYKCLSGTVSGTSVTMTGFTMDRVKTPVAASWNVVNGVAQVPDVSTWKKVSVAEFQQRLSWYTSDRMNPVNVTEWKAKCTGSGVNF